MDPTKNYEMDQNGDGEVVVDIDRSSNQDNSESSNPIRPTVQTANGKRRSQSVFVRIYFRLDSQCSMQCSMHCSILSFSAIKEGGLVENSDILTSCPHSPCRDLVLLSFLVRSVARMKYVPCQGINDSRPRCEQPSAVGVSGRKLPNQLGMVM